MGKDFMFTITNIMLEILKDRNWDDESCGIKREIMNFFSGTLSFRSKGETSNSATRVMKVLEVSAGLLTDAKEPYMKGLILEDVVSVENTSNVYHLVLSILLFYEEVFACGRYKKLANKVMGDLMKLLLFYIQLSENEIDQYTLKPDDLVEDDMSFSSVRSQCLHILEDMCVYDELQKSFESAIFPIIQEQLQEAQALKAQGNKCWWKLQEACYYVISCKQETMMNCVNKSVGSNEILNFLSTIIIPDMSSDIPFLAGRSITVLSSFSSLLPEDDLTKLVDLMISHITPEGSEVLRIFSVRALYNMYEDYNEDDEAAFNVVMRSRIAAVFAACLNTLLSVEECLLDIMFELTTLLISHQPQVCVQHETVLMQSMLAIIKLNVCNLMFKTNFEAIFNIIGPLGLCVEPIKQVWLPYIVEVLNSGESTFEECELALEILSCVVRHAKDPFNKFLVDSCFPVLLGSIRRSTDTTMYLIATECIRAYLRSSSKYIREFTDESGLSGIEIVYNLMMHLLNPQNGEGSIIYLGRLVSAFLLEFSPVMGAEQIDSVLKGTLSMLHACKTPTGTTAMLSVFIHLMHEDAPGTVNYLRSMNVQMEGGKSALQYVLSGILNDSSIYINKYEIVSLYVAIGNLLGYALESADQELAAIVVPGDQVDTKAIGDGVQTRSKATVVYQDEQLYVRMFKLILRELKRQYELRDRCEEDDIEEEDDVSDGWESESDEEDFGDGGIELLEDMVGGFLDGEDEIDPEEVINAKLVKLDLVELLEGMAARVAALDVYKSFFLPRLSTSEVLIVTKLLSKATN